MYLRKKKANASNVPKIRSEENIYFSKPHIYLEHIETLPLGLDSIFINRPTL